MGSATSPCLCCGGSGSGSGSGPVCNVDGSWQDSNGGMCSISGPNNNLTITDAAGNVVTGGVYLCGSLLIISGGIMGNASADQSNATILFWSNPDENPPWVKV
jgi:hypothetical protein